MTDALVKHIDNVRTDSLGTSSTNSITTIRSYSGEFQPAQRPKSAKPQLQSAEKTRHKEKPSSTATNILTWKSSTSARSPSSNTSKDMSTPSTNVARPSSAKARIESAKNAAISHYLNGLGMDTSYSKDRPCHGILPRSKSVSNHQQITTYETAIPEKYHVWEIAEDDPSNGDKHMRRAFPSRIPSGRKEVEMLHQCYLKMLEEVGDPLKNFDKAKVVYTCCFNELMRQVILHCTERGEFMNELYNGLITMYENKFKEILKLAKDKHEEYRRHEEEVDRINKAHLAEKQELLKKLESAQLDIKVSRERACMFASDLETTRIREKDTRESLTRKIEDYKSQVSIMKKVLDGLAEMLSASEGWGPGQNPGFNFRDDPSTSDMSFSGFNWGAMQERYKSQLGHFKSTIADGNKYKKLAEDLEVTVLKLQRQIEESKVVVSAPSGWRHVSCQTTPLEIPLPAASTKAIFTEPWAVFFDSFRLGYGRAWTFLQVIRQIDTLFKEKYQNDALADSENRPRINFQHFVHQWFMNKYGLDQLAEQHLTDFLEGIHSYYVDNIRVLTFGKFLGFFGPYSLNNLNLFLHTLHMTENSIIGPTVKDKGVGLQMISLSRAVDVARNLFTDRSPEELARFMQRLERISETSKRSTSRTNTSLGQSRSLDVAESSDDANGKVIVVSLDKFLLLVLEESERESPATDKYLAKLFAASDIYSDGELDFSEFVSIVRFADPTCSIDQAKAIFREHCDPMSGRLSLVGFLRVGRKFNYGSSWMPFLRPVKSSESNSNYFKAVLAEQKKSMAIVSHELRMIKSIGNQTATNMHEKLLYREDSVRKV
eukprot:TRINITY_DN10708_c0_g1_i2.p1 TRINITY_DN10708_c0_g1~~TRINITY_DN10708_c0_g1_i2.p1  ORF type:complete len:827 (-),score=157.04 TRINITY_DN10708_c0_g1_i2:197-2677(-)